MLTVNLMAHHSCVNTQTDAMNSKRAFSSFARTVTVSECIQTHVACNSESSVPRAKQSLDSFTLAPLAGQEDLTDAELSEPIEPEIIAINEQYRNNLTTLPDGIKYYCFIAEHERILFFQDPQQLLIQGVTPDTYEAREPGCTRAWIKCMIYMLELIHSREKQNNPILTLALYLKFNELLSGNVSNMLESHNPGQIRSSYVHYKNTTHTDKGVVNALLYKAKVEGKYKGCRGTMCETFGIYRNNSVHWLSDRYLLGAYQNYRNPTGAITLEPETVIFRPIAPTHYKHYSNTNAEDPQFRNELEQIMDKLLNKINRKLDTLYRKNGNSGQRFKGLVDILSKYLPRLQQLHPTTDGTGRTNQMLVLYLHAWFDLPPPLLMNPNATSIVNEKRCAKIFKAGMHNTLRLIRERSPLRDKIDMLPLESLSGKYYKKHTSYCLPERIQLSENFRRQSLGLTCMLNAELNAMCSSANSGTDISGSEIPFFDD